MAAPAISLSLELNHPQWKHYGDIFDETGQPYRNRLHFFPWGRGVGKTQYARFLWYLLVSKFDGHRREALKPFRGIRIKSLCPTLKQWKDINLAGIIEEVGPSGEWAFLRAKVDRQTGQVTFPGGSVITPFPASEYSARVARGMRTDVLDAEEFDDIDSSVYDAVAVPWLSEPWSIGIQLVRGTPTRGRHGLWWRTLEACKLAAKLRTGEASIEVALESDVGKAIREVFEHLRERDWPAHVPRDVDQAVLLVLKSYYGQHATYRDTPETVSPLAVAQAKATTPKATFEREWEANPDAGEGLIYPGFDEEFHVRQPPDRGQFDEFHAGMDFGSANPGALIECGIRGKDRDAELWILREWYDVELPNQVWDDRAKALRHCKFWPDSSRADRVTDLRSFGLDVGETDRGPGSVAAGIARLADLIHIRQREYTGPAYEPIVQRFARMYVAPGCTNVRRELGLYRRKKYPDGTFSDEPEKKNDHALDAIRYVALGVFGRMPNRRHEESR